ncbi:MAG: hypothetical protein ACI4A7_01600 [Prevotella sp.]
MSEKIIYMLRLLIRVFLKPSITCCEKAARGESCVYQDDNGHIYRIAAKDVIASNPRFQ